jgi:3-hydroxyisobutyrate dehydrogenase-like beta-hydroxyacid dehydrogenase
MRTDRNVGVVGLGIIGSRVARNLRDKGFQLQVWNRTKKETEGFAKSLSDLAQHSQVIQIFVANDQAVLETIQDLSAGLTADHLIILNSTISPRTAESVREKLTASGTSVVDAPFTGSKAAAEKGQLVYYLAGDKPAVERARPVLEASSKEILFFDKFGDAGLVKIATNMISAAIVESLAEALALTEKAGVDSKKFVEAVEKNACRSGVSDLKLRNMISGDFEAHFSLRNMLKDSRLALELAAQYKLGLPATEAVKNVLEKAHDQGLDEKDYAVVAQLVREGQANSTEVK